MHALGLTPLLYQSAWEQQTQRPSHSGALLPCPFTDAAYDVVVDATKPNPNRHDRSRSTTRSTTVGLSEAMARRILAEERQKQYGLSQRWATICTSKRDRRHNHHDQDVDDGAGGPVDPTNTTLFVYGLHKDVTGQLPSSATGDALIVQALSGAQAVRRPTTTGAATSSFCFVDFASHDAAKRCLEMHQPCVTIQGVELTIRWASRTSGGGGGGSSSGPSTCSAPWGNSCVSNKSHPR